MKLASLALAVAALSAAGTAQAVTYTYSGALTTASPTFNRPLTTTSLSAVGTAVYYSTLSFAVSASGSYDFLTTSVTGYDPFTALYSPTFVPSSGLTNVRAVNDDFNSSLALSGFTYALTAGTNYVFVNTAFSNGATGTFSTTITGPGSVITGSTPAIPEPQTYALMALGLAAFAVTARRRAARDSAV